MDSQDQQDNSQNGFLNLPLELHNEITSYLATLNIKPLSQTSVALRNVYNPILYRNCKVSDQYQSEYIPKTYWMIPFWLLYSPSNYSWFPNQAVQNIVVTETFSIPELKSYIKPSDYPSLKSLKVVPDTYHSPLVVTQKNRVSFAERDFRFPHLSTNEFLPAFKTDEQLIKCPTRTGPYYVLQCNNMEIRSMIASLNLSFLRVIFKDEIQTVTNIATELKAFPNLKDLKIWCSDGSHYESFKAVIDSVTKLESLDSLMIHYRINRMNVPHFSVLDNLKGSWKKFDFCLGFDQCHSASGLFLRLPTVTNLMLSYDNRYHLKYYTFEGNLEFGSGIKQLTFPFYSAGQFLSEYHRSQNVLDNLTTLKVVFPPSPLSEFYQENIEMVVFTKVLPNLKTFEIQMQNFRIMPEHELDGFRDVSKTLFSLVPFGEFDILNYESIKAYIMELKRSALLKWKKDGNKVKTLKKCIKLLERANEDSNIYDLYYNFFLLQFLHSAFKVDTFSRKDNNEYSKHRAIISVLLLRLLEYAPNLETLTLLGVPLHEEFAAFHRLVKYHKHLKTVSARMISIGSKRLHFYTPHASYSQYYRFIKLVKHEIHDNQVFARNAQERSGVHRVVYYDLEGVEYDVEGIRNCYRYDCSWGPDSDLVRCYSATNGGDCVFTEPLQLDINEVRNYTNRQDLLNRCRKERKYLDSRTFRYL